MRIVSTASIAVASTLLLRLIGCSPQPVPQDQTAVVAPQVAPPVDTSGETRPSSTRAVQCGNETCIAGEASCVRFKNKEPKCVSKTEADEYSRGGSDEDSVVACDDNSDCQTGERCCAGQYWGGTGPHMHLCEKEACAEAIACVVPSDCPAGLACHQGDTGDGHCEVASPGAQCGATRCSGATPACCWNNETEAGQCIADPGYGNVCASEAEQLVRCRGTRDCGGYSCCLMMLNRTQCWGTCPGTSLGVACETMADCPPEGPGPGGMRQRYDACENGACTGKLCYPSGAWVPCDSM